MKNFKHWLATMAVLLCSITTSAVTYSDWTSTNKGQSSSTSSNTYNITASAGDMLTFDWLVSSESGYDKLIVTLSGSEILNKSGEQSGTYQHTFTSSGSYTMVVKYTKDGSVNNGSDYAKVYNIVKKSASIASGTCGSNLTWNLTNDGELTIEGTGEMTSTPWCDSYSSEIKSVTIGEGVTNIYNSAFCYCSNLTSITIPESVTSIEEWAFHNCSSLTSITIPESVTSIGNYAFESCYGLLSVSISGAVSIGYYAFSECENLTTISMSDGFVSIGHYAFRNCVKLSSSITLSKNLSVVAPAAFSNCYNLASITCEATTPPTCYERAFENVKKTIPVYVPAVSVEAYKAAEGWNAFSNIQPILNIIASGTCGTNLTWKLSDEGKLIIEGTGGMSQWTSGYSSVPWSDYINDIKSVDICNGVTSIGMYAFYGCRNLTSVTIPNSVTSIAPFAFRGCYNLVSIDLPENITHIYEETFYGCGFTSITIPESVVNIQSGAFYGTGLTSISIPKNVTDIAYDAFTACRNLSSIVVAEGNTVYDSRNSSNAIIETNSNTLLLGCSTTIIPNGIVGIGSSAFYNGNLTSIIIPESVMNIGSSAFFGCSSLQSINIPEGLTSIEDYTFCGCSSLTSINIPESVTSIGSSAFSDCSSITSINIPASVTSISRSTFADCSSLQSITISKNVNSISRDAFFNCYNLASITCLAMTPPGTSNAFSGVDKAIPVYVPAGSISTYQLANYWKEFTNIQAIPEIITINQYGSSTYCSEYALDFSEVAGLKAYVATGYDTETGVVTLTRVMTAKAGVGLFIKGEPGEYIVPTLENTSFNTLNMLVGTLEKTELNGTSDDGLYANYKYTIKEGDAEPMFYQFADGSTLSAERAYLQIPTKWLPKAESKAIRLRFVNGETTDIEEIESTDNYGQTTIIYDLMGRRVENPSKGCVYIVNGRKVVY